jgi:hypothetical protein
VTPAPLLREERMVLLINEDRVTRALVLGTLFGVLGVVGTLLGLSGRGDTWLPFVGVPFVMALAIAYVWNKTRCPRCETRVLVGRRRLPLDCPTCGVGLLRADDPRRGTGAATQGAAAVDPLGPEAPPPGGG